MKLLITITPNLEKLLQNEIKTIIRTNKLHQPKSLKVLNGGIEIDLNSNNEENNKYIWAFANTSRLAESIRIRFGEPFRVNNFNQFKDNLDNLPWFEYFTNENKDSNGPKVLVSSSGSTLYHTNAIKERFLQHINTNIKDKISIDINKSKFKPIKKLLKNLKSKQRKGSDDQDQKEIEVKINELQDQLNEMIKNQHELNTIEPKVYIRIENNKAQCTIDAVCNNESQLFHKRTPNKHITDAPIRETLASAIINETGYNINQSSLWDPFCGSATIIQEACSILLKSQPSNSTNYKRSFQFEQFKSHSPKLYSEYLKSIEKLPYPLKETTYFIGSDIDSKAIDASIFNLKNQSYLNDNNIQFIKGDFQFIYNETIEKLSKSSKPFTIITNLPYGTRILYEDSIIDQENEDSDEHYQFKKSDIYLNNNLSNDLKDLFKRFGNMLNNSDKSILKDVFVLNGNSHFESISTNNGNHNFIWKRILNFKNGGLSVELLKMIKKD